MVTRPALICFEQGRDICVDGDVPAVGKAQAVGTGIARENADDAQAEGTADGFGKERIGDAVAQISGEVLARVGAR